MPHVIYSGISLSPISDFRLAYETITDDTQSDFCFLAAHVSGTFIVNGQVDVRQLDDPPTSYIDTGLPTTRPAEAVRTRPDGLAAPPAGFDAPKPTEGAERQKGAVTSEFLPYKGFVNSPAYAVENQPITRLDPSAGSAPASLSLITSRLTDLRGQLFVYENTDAGTEVILQSPGYDFHCDAKSGPIPKLTDVTHTQGDGVTFYVNWSCVTYLRRVPKSSVIEPLLSNRWIMTHHIRNGGYTDIAVNGVALFDLGLLHKLGTNADNHRPFLMLPVPFGYERRDCDVTESADGSTINYNFVDYQLEVYFPAGVYEYVTEVETEHRQYILCDNDVLSGALSAMDSTLNRRWMLEAGKRDSKRERSGKEKALPPPPTP